MGSFRSVFHLFVLPYQADVASIAVKLRQELLGAVWLEVFEDSGSSGAILGGVT